MRILAAVMILFAAAARCSALDFGVGPMPVAFEPSTPVALTPGGRIEIAGTIEGSLPAMVVLRVDDGRSTDFTSRMNAERTLPPGPFKLSFDVGSLRANNGRTLDATDIRRVILFIVGQGSGRVTQFASGDTAVAPAK